MNNQRNNLLIKENEIKLKIEDNNIILLNKNNKKLKEEIEEYNNRKSKEKEILLNYYEKDEFIRLFYDKQFIQLYNLMKNKKISQLKNLIFFIFAKEINNLDQNRLENEDENFDKRLQYISDFLKANKISPQELYKTNSIKMNSNKLNEKNVYLKSFHNDEYESISLEIFYELTGNLPSYSNILIYNEETIEEEILSFIFRVIKCESKSLFVLILNEDNSINKEKKYKYLFDVIKKYIIHKNNKSIFLILFSDKNKIIFDNIKEYEPFPDIRCNDVEKNNIKNILKNISIVLSDSCGLGKTNYIKSNKEKDETYIIFPLGGYLDRNKLIDRLNQDIGNEEEKKYIIHIDLYDTIFDQMLKEFLFKFLILKYYGYNDRIFSYNYTKVKIKIEIPNSYFDYLNKYKLLNYFGIKKYYKIDKIKEIEIENKTDNNKLLKRKKQFVGNILRIYNNKTIKDKNIQINSEESYKNEGLPIINIPEEELNLLISNAFIDNIKKLKNIENYYPNFYQKNIFINFLFSEFKKFMECYDLNPEIVILNVDNYLADLRMDIIKSLIENSIYFTFTCYDKIINKESN